MNKIVYITSGKNGLHRFTFNELNLLIEHGIEFELCLTQLNKGPYMPNNEWAVNIATPKKALIQSILFFLKKRIFLELLIDAYKNGVVKFFLIALSFYFDIKNKKIHGIHCQMGDDKLYIGYYLKKILGCQLTVTVHAHELYQRKVYENNFELRKLFASCDWILTISEFNKTILINKFGVLEDKIKIMYLYPEIDPRGVLHNKKKILTVANWVEKKGYRTLLKSLKKLDRDDFVLWVVGSPTFSRDSIDLPELIKEMGMEQKVEILGSFGGTLLEIVFMSCDIFCLPSVTEYYEDGNPSEREGIPVAIMEAMAWEKPVISTNHAGIPELVKDFLVDEHDIDGLSDRLNYLLDNREMCHEIGRENKKNLKKKFTRNNVKILTDVLLQNK